MPLQLHIDTEAHVEIGLWKIEESEDWFREQLLLHPSELQALAKIKGEGRRKEWLASRWLLHIMSGRTFRGACLKDGLGKPYLENSSYEISLSHTHQRAAVIASKRPCGIDVQQLVPAIVKLGPKFINDTEKAWMDPNDYIRDLHLIWGAKEALYKTFSRKKMDFKKQLIIESIDRKSKTMQGKILKHYEQNRILHYDWVEEDYLLVYTF